MRTAAEWKQSYERQLNCMVTWVPKCLLESVSFRNRVGHACTTRLLRRHSNSMDVWISVKRPDTRLCNRRYYSKLWNIINGSRTRFCSNSTSGSGMSLLFIHKNILEIYWTANKSKLPPEKSCVPDMNFVQHKSTSVGSNEIGDFLNSGLICCIPITIIAIIFYVKLLIYVIDWCETSSIC